MHNAESPAPDSLSRRERDCLDLLRTGLHTPQVAAALGISLSTLHKHLAAARRKLRVRRTAQALLRPHADASPPNRHVLEGDHWQLVCDFAGAVEACATFEQGWNALMRFAGQLGVTNMTCGIVAEPPGRLTNGAHAVRIYWPDELMRLYREMGGEAFDPVIPYVVKSTRPILVDNESLISGMLGNLPKPVASFGSALLDHRIRYILCQPGRDRITGAPLATTFVFDAGTIGALQRNLAPVPALLQAMARAFWDFVQTRRLLSGIPGLSLRQVEALRFAARGFTVAETADHMAVSRRSAEGIFAEARRRLGAPTTASALYRAMVYRSLT